ncbi:MAG TPA: ABC transporter permease, partial [Chitinophagaceae bacterium]|nr:ABC transporter permease [Chitinophagaceae bacterium]
MIRNYFKIAWRNLLRNKVSSFINIGGLAIGMGVAILIGLWIYDELSFNKNFAHYDRIAQVMQHGNINGDIYSGNTIPAPMGEELRKNFGNDFKNVTMASWNSSHILSNEDKKLTQGGTSFEPSAIDLLSIKILNGTKTALNEPASIMLSASSAKAYFGNADPMGKVMKIDNDLIVKVTAVYEDFPLNSSFDGINFITPWQLLVTSQ